MKLDPKAIEVWLTAKPEGSKVGMSNYDISCPLATYLQEQTDKVWLVYSTYYTPLSSRHMMGEHYTMELWATNFVHRVDGIANREQIPITCEQALQVLADVQRSLSPTAPDSAE
jgi:hypothetical protein